MMEGLEKSYLMNSPLPTYDDFNIENCEYEDVDNSKNVKKSTLKTDASFGELYKVRNDNKPSTTKPYEKRYRPEMTKIKLDSIEQSGQVYELWKKNPHVKVPPSS